ncbi:MAG: M48 family metallopeptidase [Gammaproteobacteria bacterium]
MRLPIRLLIAAAMVIFAVVSYFSVRQENPVTGETQHISLSPDQEIALGLEAAPQMAGQMGGLYPNEQVQDYVNRIGQTVVANSRAKNGPYQYQFHVLADDQTVNAFALPGGQIFITSALLSKLENEAQLAGVLGHEIGHVIGRHAAEHLAKGKLSQLLVGAAGVAGSDQMGGGQGTAMIASVVANLTSLQYGRKDELESDTLGIDFMAEAGYDPRAMVGVMDILENASGGQGRGPSWLQSHPDPGNRRESIRQRIAEKFPNGVSDTRGTGDEHAFRAMQAQL